LINVRLSALLSMIGSDAAKLVASRDLRADELAAWPEASVSLR
jgi:hypothetical protein